MRISALVVLLNLAIGSQSFASESCTHTPTTFKCLTFVENYDGDTLTLHIPRVTAFFGRYAKVRINGIDAPEIRGKTRCEQQKALEAKAYLHKLLHKARSIELRNVKKEKYFRILGDLYADGKNIGPLLIAAHLAVAYDGGHKTEVDWCR